MRVQRYFAGLLNPYGSLQLFSDADVSGYVFGSPCSILALLVAALPFRPVRFSFDSVQA